MKQYLIGINTPHKGIVTGYLGMGGSNPAGVTLGLNNYYLEMNGKPFFPVCGEFHFSRYPWRDWEDELLKIKMAGVGIIATYIFWIYHEEEEERFNWSGNFNLRRFVDLCAKHQLYVILRIGPFAHGECRNGGLPDWLYGRPFEVRSNDEGYLAYVKRFYREIERQVAGRMFKDGGPIVGVQLENEFAAASAKWEPSTLQGDEWISGGTGGVEHMRILKQMAVEVGFDVPLFTCTGWGNAPVLEGEMLPMWGGYAFQPWLLYWNPDVTEHPPTDNYIFRDYHRNDSGYLDAAYPTNQYPFACCELGGGMACWYNHRFVVPPESIEAMVVNRVAGGCNFLGYYMFHGGSAPVGKRSYLNERCVPKISYDFQAPLGEFGQIKESYHYLKLLHLFLRDFAGILCPMATVLPEGAAQIPPTDTETLRFAARADGASGFLFLTNYQDHLNVKDHENIQITIKLPDEEIVFPAQRGLTLKKDVSAIFPFNLRLDGVLVKYATTQLITTLSFSGESYYFFFAPEGVAGEYCVDRESITDIRVENGQVLHATDKQTTIAVNPGVGCRITVFAETGKRVNIVTLTREEALTLWKTELWGRERIILTDAAVGLVDNGFLELRQNGNPSFRFSVFPDGSEKMTMHGGDFQVKSADGIFTRYAMVAPPKKGVWDWRRVSSGKAVIRVSPEAFDGESELFLRVNYRGDVGSAFINGKLIHDNFCNGETWEIGLKRFYPEAAENVIYLYVSPEYRGTVVYRDAALAVKADFEGEAIAEIRSIELIPEYRMKVSKHE